MFLRIWFFFGSRRAGIELLIWMSVLECLGNTCWGAFMDLWIGLAYGRPYVWFILGSAG